MNCTRGMNFCAQAARIWSAVTCHRFCRFGDLSPKQGRVQRSGRIGRLVAFDGDKSPAESADKSAHSKGARLFPSPGGRLENSPAVHCRVWIRRATSPEGTAESSECHTDANPGL